MARIYVPANTPPPARPPTTREHSKQATAIAMLQRPGGATIAQICETTGWQSRAVRGTVAGAFKKKLGLNLFSEKLVHEHSIRWRKLVH